uniref:Uncharacterized protein n=1 Tax=Anopheles coluzzii TaxID=1518534 RepID=A0A8W7PC11_ANOCL
MKNKLLKDFWRTTIVTKDLNAGGHVEINNSPSKGIVLNRMKVNLVYEIVAKCVLGSVATVAAINQHHRFRAFKNHKPHARRRKSVQQEQEASLASQRQSPQER